MSMDEDQEKLFTKKSKQVKHKFIIITIIQLSAFMVLILSFLGFLKPESESLEIWFQRSGSIVVLLAVFAEIILFKFNALLWPDSFPMKYQEKLRYVYGSDYKMLSFFNALIAILGTLIWGYGDLIISLI